MSEKTKRRETGQPYHRPDFVDDLDATLRHAWACLARGVKDRRSPFHTPTIATLGTDGRPRMRTVVLRAVDTSARSLRFHTDQRGLKSEEIARDSRVAVHVYDARGKFQLRGEGIAQLHAGDALAQAAWDGSRMMSRACYATQPAPGTLITAPGAFALPEDEAAIAAGAANFSAVTITIAEIETLYLDHAGHRRARFRLDLDERQAQWLAP
ncbi:pyridoxamine 5'-phosphate oxidase family protein [Saliniramus sp.]|uniref:pyridoxamine 5'-phosphate oxidase family protein n=1 Tax=Saliniramus sp. TaxID=2986772 RepID=UPI002B5B44AC|nr:pyridoxamine 5'-phosphate oxidase family protein [Saliniramus sp.]HMB09923.1 pyridoxamine 5'-phosphate oxidase family protein [Saliniramus sp.]